MTNTTAGRPECFEFAMDFLGSPEAEQVRAYIESLEAALAREAASVDAERLSWLEANYDLLTRCAGKWFSVTQPNTINTRDTLREAIDAARATDTARPPQGDSDGEAE